MAAGWQCAWEGGACLAVYFEGRWREIRRTQYVRYFTQGLRRRKWKLFDELRKWEVQPELEGAEANTQASWLASQAVIWASLRDFARARACIDRAKSLETRESWVFSCESDVFGMEDRWNEALASAEISWEMNAGTPYGAHSLGNSLVNLQCSSILENSVRP